MTSFFVASEGALKKALSKEFIHMRAPMPEELAPFFTLLKKTESPTKFYYQRRKLDDPSPPSSPPHIESAEAKAEADFDPEPLTSEIAELNLSEPVVLTEDEKYRNEVTQVAIDLKYALFQGEPAEGFLTRLQELIVGDPRRDLLSPTTSDIDRLIHQIKKSDFEVTDESNRELVSMALANAIVDSNPKALDVARSFLVCVYQKEEEEESKSECECESEPESKPMVELESESESESESEKEKEQEEAEAHVTNTLVPMCVIDNRGIPELNVKNTGIEVDEDYVRSWTNVSLNV